MSDVTRILSAIEQRNPQAAEHWLPRVHGELRHFATSKDEALKKPGATDLIRARLVELRGFGPRSAAGDLPRPDRSENP